MVATKNMKSNLIDVRESHLLRKNSEGLALVAGGVAALGVGIAEFNETSTSYTNVWNGVAIFEVNGLGANVQTYQNPPFSIQSSSPSDSGIETLSVYYNGKEIGTFTENLSNLKTEQIHFGNQVFTYAPTQHSSVNITSADVSSAVANVSTVHPMWTEMAMVLGAVAVVAGSVILIRGWIKNRNLRRRASAA